MLVYVIEVMICEFVFLLLGGNFCYCFCDWVKVLYCLFIIIFLFKIDGIFLLEVYNCIFSFVESYSFFWVYLLGVFF